MSATVGVLAVLDRVAARLRSPQRFGTARGKEAYAVQLDDARATVAALIETLEALATSADSDPFCSIGHVFEHGAGSAVRDLVALAKGGAA